MGIFFFLLVMEPFFSPLVGLSLPPPWWEGWVFFSLPLVGEGWGGG